MKFIKTRDGSKMGDDFLWHNMIIYVEKKIASKFSVYEICWFVRLKGVNLICFEVFALWLNPGPAPACALCVQVDLGLGAARLAAVGADEVEDGLDGLSDVGVGGELGMAGAALHSIGFLW